MLPENTLIGQKIRKRRGDFSLSLRDLSEKTGLTASYLSQIERGLIAPSLNSMRKISEALNAPLLFFFTNTIKRSPVVRSNERTWIDLDHTSFSFQLLTPDIDHKIEVVSGTLEPGSGNVVRSLRTPTEEFLMVLEGALLVGVDEEKYILNPGDTIYFEGQHLNQLSCASDQKVCWISVITPPVF